MVVKLNGSKTKLVKGMKLYCASHGVGEIVSIDEKEYFGEKMSFCEMKFEKDDLKILIPLKKLEKMGVRQIISKDMAQKIVNMVLNKKAKNAKGIWTKRIVECETKLYSGNPLLIAEVVRDLFCSIKDLNKSYGEKVLFEKAFDRFVEEYSLALEITFEEAYKTIYDVLNKNYITTTVNKEIDEDIEDISTSADDFSDDDIDFEESSSKISKKQKTA